ncbi:MAG: transposase [Flavobacteriales bacterium]|nr:transposase [Flavobacteriales bacterium]
MRKSKFTEKQIVGMLKQHEAGMNMEDICREYGIFTPAFPKGK